MTNKFDLDSFLFIIGNIYEPKESPRVRAILKMDKPSGPSPRLSLTYTVLIVLIGTINIPRRLPTKHIVNIIFLSFKYKKPLLRVSPYDFIEKLKPSLILSFKDKKLKINAEAKNVIASIKRAPEVPIKLTIIPAEASPSNSEILEAEELRLLA